MEDYSFSLIPKSELRSVEVWLIERFYSDYCARKIVVTNKTEFRPFPEALSVADSFLNFPPEFETTQELLSFLALEELKLPVVKFEIIAIYLITIHTYSGQFIIDSGLIQPFWLIHSDDRLLSDAFQMNRSEDFKYIVQLFCDILRQDKNVNDIGMELGHFFLDLFCQGG